MPRSTTITARTSFVGVSQLARETSLSQGYISKLLARGWPEHEIRVRAKWAAFKRELRARRVAERERWEKRHR